MKILQSDVDKRRGDPQAVTFEHAKVATKSFLAFTTFFLNITLTGINMVTFVMYFKLISPVDIFAVSTLALCTSCPSRPSITTLLSMGGYNLLTSTSG